MPSLLPPLSLSLSLSSPSAGIGTIGSKPKKLSSLPDLPLPSACSKYLPHSSFVLPTGRGKINGFYGHSSTYSVKIRTIDRNQTAILRKTCYTGTDVQEKARARLREIAPRGQREPGGGIHATESSPFLACLHIDNHFKGSKLFILLSQRSQVKGTVA